MEKPGMATVSWFRHSIIPFFSKYLKAVERSAAFLFAAAYFVSFIYNGTTIAHSPKLLYLAFPLLVSRTIVILK
jgi:hypothetical protein